MDLDQIRDWRLSAGKSSKRKRSRYFEKSQTLKSIKRTKELLDGDGDDEEYRKKKENDSRSYSEWDSEDGKSENSDESDVDFQRRR